MEKVAAFQKVSFAQFKKDWICTFGEEKEEKILEIYDNIKLPKRATAGSAGYDFFTPIDFTLYRKDTIKIPTGIRCVINDGWVLTLYPRSGLGFKYRESLDNTVGIIDNDYHYSDNEGHIFVKVTNDTYSDKILTVKAGEGFIQGIFLPFGITVDDATDGIRNGGFGSTTERK